MFNERLIIHSTKIIELNLKFIGFEAHGRRYFRTGTPTCGRDLPVGVSTDPRYTDSRLLGDFDLAEDALHDAFRAALQKWSKDGVPTNPRAWLISAGRFKAIDAMRRNTRFDASQADLVGRLYTNTDNSIEIDDASIEDDQLRLIFTCYHPDLVPAARVALTLREICGLTTEEIASAFLVPPSTLAQRIVRAKAKIRDARIPYQVPSPSELLDRLDTVLQVIYLVFNEGNSASSGPCLTRSDLSNEAIRLGRLLLEASAR